MLSIGLGHYLTLAAIIFTIGVVGIFLNRKNVIVILMSIELILLSNGERIQSYDLVAITDVKKKSFISALWDNLIFSVYSFFMQDETT
jgi:NADH-quinone oxidoreductase subunit K